MGFKDNISVTIDIGANISQVRAAANEMQSILGKINLDKGVSSNLTNMFSQLNSALGELEAKSGKSLHSLSDTKGVESSISKVQSIIATINGELGRLGSGGTAGWQKLTAGLVGQMQTATQAVKQYKDALAATEKEGQSLERTHKKAMEASTNATARATEMQGKYAKAVAQADAAEKRLAQDVAKRDKKQEEYNNAQKDVKNKKAEIERFKKANDLHFTKDGEFDKRYKISPDVVSQYENLTSQLSSLESAAQRAGESLEKANNTVTKSTGQHEAAAASVDAVKIKLNAAKDDAEKAAQALQASSDAVKKFNDSAKNTSAFDQLKNTLSKTFGDETFKSVNNLEELEAKMQQFAETASGEVKSGIEQMLNALQKGSPALKEAGEKARDAGRNFKEMTDRGKDLDMLSSRLKYFFGVMGGFQIFKRAIRGAVETIKELDAAMTQTAVVSTKTVGQMWKTLPEYSKKAKELAASMKDVYSAQTLYVQQGLSMDSALNLGVETLKMARVAGIDAATATDSMTAALRGFKMELNETSATRINDVYSKLAQNTASNVKEISTAMTKVASLASNANMSFENTAAYLSKIIETTREGAETAGTALKTVIARFSEVKKLYSEGELTGTTEEGEEVDVNKIAKALREVGINMNEYFTGAVGLDTIFGKLGEKWSSLTTIQQRYIATQAAGSRQQSRFIALMQNWSRTTELMNMAYNSEGSGQEQFEKTLDSLDAKITKLKTEWQSFIMGIANNEAIKSIISAGTRILEIINNIMDKLSGGNGTIKSVLSVLAGVLVFKGAGAVVKRGLTGVGALMGGGLARSGALGPGAKAGANNSSFREKFSNRWGNISAGFSNGSNRTNIIAAQREAKLEAKAAYKAYNSELKQLKKSKAAEAAYLKEKGDRDEHSKTKAAMDRGIEKQEGEVAKKKGELDAANKKLDQQTQQSTQAIQQYGAAMQAAGVAAGVLAGILGAVAGAMEKAGNKKGAAWVGGLAKGFGVLSAALTLCGTMFMAFGAAAKAGSAMASAALKSIPFIGWAAAIIGAIVAVISIFNELHETAEEKAERLTEETENAKEIADRASKAYDALFQARDEYKELLTQIQELAKGTDEYREAVEKLNAEVLKLSDEYPELEYSYNATTGMFEISDESWDKALQAENNRKSITGAVSSMASGYSSIANARVGGRDQLAEMVPHISGVNDVWQGAGRVGYNIGAFFTGEDYLDLDWRKDLANQLSDEEIAKVLNNLTENQIQAIVQPYIDSRGENGGYVDIWNAARDLVIAANKFDNSVTVFAGSEKEFAQAAFASSDKSEEAWTLTQAYDIYDYTEIRKNATNGVRYGDWSREDFAKTDSTGNSIWQRILSYGLDQSLLSDAQYNQFLKGGQTETNIRAAYAAFTNQSVADIKDIDFKTIENWMGSVYETVAISDQLKKDEKILNNLDPVLKEAYLTLANTPNKLTNKQKAILQNGGIKILQNSLPSISDKYWDTMAQSLNTIEFKKNGISNLDFYDKTADKKWTEHNNYSEIISDSYEKIFSTIIDSSLKDVDKKTILSILNSSDITSLSSLWSGLDTLKEQGIDLKKRAPDIYNAYVEYINLLESYGIAFNKMTNEKALEKTLKAEELSKQAKEKEGKFTKEEFEEISKLLKDSKYSDELNNFLMQADGSYQYFGDDLNTIISILHEIAVNTAEDQEASAEAEALAHESFKKAGTKKLEDLTNFETSYGYSVYTGFKRWEETNGVIFDENYEDLSTGSTSGTGDQKIIVKNGTAGIEYSTRNGEDTVMKLPEEPTDTFSFHQRGEYAHAIEDLYDAYGRLPENKVVPTYHQPDEYERLPSGVTYGENGEPIDYVLSPEDEEYNQSYYEEPIYQVATIDQLQNLLPEQQGFYRAETTQALRELGYDTTILEAAESFDDFIGLLYGDTIKVGKNENGFYGTNQLGNNVILEGQYPRYYAATDAAKKIANGEYTPDDRSTIENSYTDEEKVHLYNEFVKESGLSESQLAEVGLIKQIDPELLPDYFDKFLDLVFANPNELAAKLTEAQKNKIPVLSNEELYNYINDETKAPEVREMAQRQLDYNAENNESSNGYLLGWQGISHENLSDNSINIDEEISNDVKVLATELAEVDKKIIDCRDDLKSSVNTLKTAKQGTKEWNDAAAKTQKLMKNIFGVNLDTDHLEESKDLIDKWLKGEKGSLKALGDYFSDSGYLDDVFTTGADGETENITNDVQDIIYQALDNVDTEGNPVPIYFTEDSDSLGVVDADAKAAIDAMAQAYGIEMVWEKVPPINEITGQPGYKLKTAGVSGAAFNGGGGGKGGGGGGGKEFKNDFDKYYNLVEDINELMRLRNLLETDYNQLLEAEGTSGKQIYDNLKKQVDLLKERQKLTADLAEKRKGQIFDLLNDEEYKDVKQYAWWNEEDQTIEIDWDAINKIKDSETGNKIKELVQKLEDFQSKYDEQIEALEEIEDALEDIRKRGRDEYISLEERLRDALIAKIQEQIDELSATNEAIDTANSNLMDSIQKALDQQRQERENEKTEEELANKEQRLAYLQQDSSGANAVEIAQLQKELDEARENYTDQLIDQKISELQEQNDEAAQQRQEQIDLMQQSLDWQEKNGEFWEQAYQILEQSIGPDGSLLKGSELEQLLKSSDAWQGLSAEGKMKWLEELEKMVAQATGYLSLSRQLEDIGTKAGEKITFTNAEGKTLTGVVDEDGNVVVTDKNGNKITYKDVYQDYFGKYHTLESEKDAKTESKPATSTGGSGGNKDPGGSKGTGKDWSIEKSGSQWVVKSTPNKGQYSTEAEAKSAAYEKNKLEKIWGTKLVNGRYSPYLGGGSLTFSEANSIASDLNAGKNVITPYATGGLNTKTGPAWLDGTKSHPELVLNARDTENFIQLKDHLATLRQMSTNGIFGSGGDNYYDINVHVDSLGSDYDVDMAIDRIKARIYQDGAYRNVNTLNRLR